MMTVGLTGNIGSGKSLVASVFKTMGIPVFHADESGHKILCSQEVILALQDRWAGRLRWTPDGKPERASLAQIVFENPEELEYLNLLIHPRVKAAFSVWCQQYQESVYVLHEAAILHESGLADSFDAVILVTAPADIRLSRVMIRDGKDADAIRKRMKTQWPEETKIPLSRFIIQNDGRQALIPQVYAIHSRIMAGLPFGK